jgi:hypothetical protein
VRVVADSACACITQCSEDSIRMACGNVRDQGMELRHAPIISTSFSKAGEPAAPFEAQVGSSRVLLGDEPLLIRAAKRTMDMYTDWGNLTLNSRL